MSSNIKVITQEGTPTYLGNGAPASGLIVTEFNNVSVESTDYHPVWLNALADDVTLEGSMMNGAVLGPEAVRSIVGYIRTLYENQEFNFTGPYGDNGFLEDYRAGVRGQPIAGSSWSRATLPGRRTTLWPTIGPAAHCSSCRGW